MRDIFLRKPVVLVTGGTGRVGRQVLPALRALAPGVDWKPVARDAVPVAADAVIALWGATSGDETQLGLNETLARRAMALGRDVGADRVLHLSTNAVYDPAIARPDEDAASVPSEGQGYAAAKRRMEHAILGAPQEKPRQASLRLCNVVGADSLGPALRQGEARLTRFADGRGPVRSMIAPGDLARVLAGLIALPSQQLPQLLNVAAPEPVDMADILRAAGCHITPVPPRGGDRARAEVDTGRLLALLPGLDLATTAQDMVADWRRWSGAR